MLLSVNNLCKKGDRKGRPYEYACHFYICKSDSKGSPYEYACHLYICRGDLYGRPFCTDYLQK